MNKITPSISVLLLTYNHRRSVFDCLTSIQNQTHQPDHVIVVETIKDHPLINQSLLDNLFKTSKTTYIRMSKGTEFMCRNEAMKYVRDDIILFIDDDVIVDRNYIERLLSLYKTHPSVQSFVGRIYPKKQEYWQEFINHLYTAHLINPNKAQKVETWPTLNFSIRTACVKKNHLKYNGGYTAIDDLGFCLRLKAAGYSIYYSPLLHVVHASRNTTLDFIRTYSRYFENVKKFNVDNPDCQIFNVDFLSIKSNNKLIYFCKLVKRIMFASNSFRHQLKLPLKYYVACVLYFYALYIGYTNSKI